MALHTFVAGDVLEAQQLNDSFAAVAGLTLISTTTIGSAVSSVTVTNAFSATYDAYKIVITGGASSAANPNLRVTLGATTSGYAMQLIYGTYTNSVAAAGSSAQASWLYAGSGTPTTLSMNVDLLNPYLTEFSIIGGMFADSASGGVVGGYLNNTTSYTDFTVTVSTGTITGGNIRVYGYKN